MALKKMKKSELADQYSQLALKHELFILDNTDHPNIVRVYEILEDEKYYGIV